LKVPKGQSEVVHRR